MTVPVRWLDELGCDTAYGLRILRNRPRFTAAVLLSLALGIGANTAIFSLIVLAAYLPARRAGRGDPVAALRAD